MANKEILHRNRPTLVLNALPEMRGLSRRDRADLAKYHEQLDHSTGRYTGNRETANEKRFYGRRRYRGG